MTFLGAIASGFRNYVTFSGRAARSEYWYWGLFTVIGGIVAGLVDIALFGVDTTLSPIAAIFNLACLLPSLALAIRRLHDIDRTGWWLLIVFTIVGLIVLIVWACLKGTTGPNRYGPDPLAVTPP